MKISIFTFWWAMLVICDRCHLKISAIAPAEQHRRQQQQLQNFFGQLQGFLRLLQQQSPSPAPLETDRTAILDGVAGDANAQKSWGDSYSVGDECFCDSSYDHDIGTVLIQTPLFDENVSIRDACTLIGPGPGNYDIEPRPIYNDIQCGNGPPNNAGDENTCPGRVEYGAEGCSSIGPKWNWNRAFPYSPIELQSGQELNDLLDFKYIDKINGGFVSVDVLIDVRSISEFNAGHIENATLLQNLNQYVIGSNGTTTSSMGESIASPLDIIGCQYCTIVVYCRSGSRAGQAIQILRRAGFKGQLINGLGTQQWTDAGYALVSTPSIEASCASSNSRESIVCTERWESYQAQQPTPTTFIPMPPTTILPSPSPTIADKTTTVPPTINSLISQTVAPTIKKVEMNSDAPTPVTSSDTSSLPSDLPSLLPSDASSGQQPSDISSDQPTESPTSVDSELSDFPTLFPVESLTSELPTSLPFVPRSSGFFPTKSCILDVILILGPVGWLILQ